MKRLDTAIVLVILAVGGMRWTACAQDTDASQQPSQTPPGQAQRGDRGAWGGAGGMMGRGVMGTVTAAAPDHFTVKTEAGDLYTIHYSVNTRIMKGGGGQRRGQGETDVPANPPEQIKASDIKVGDAIASSGEIDASAKSVGAVVIFLIEPERAKQMREMQANYGKTWLMGRVTAVNETNVTLEGGPDNATHKFVADENTTFRKRREPITLADIQVGDMVRVDGAVKNGSFLAATVAVMGPRPEQGADAKAPRQ